MKPKYAQQLLSIFFLTGLLVCSISASAQRLAPFLSLSGNRGYPAITNPIPYEKPQSRFEYIDSTCTFLIQKKTGWTYTAYFEVKDSLQELGIRVISPLPDLLSPRKGDIVTPAYESKPANAANGFKPEVYLFKAKPGDVNFVELEDMTPLQRRNWISPGFRLVDSGNGVKLAPGIYKLVIFTQDRKKPSGSFVVEFGSVPKIQMPVLVSSPEALK
ncbi:MAG: hypothetical protein U0Y08_04585 [Bacteroidia bacterium]